MGSNTKILSVVLIIVLAGAGGYYYLSNNKIASEDSSSETKATGEDILVLVEKLKAISIDTSLFSGELFNSLKDTTIPLTPEAQGRSNPFAQLGSETSVK